MKNLLLSKRFSDSSKNTWIYQIKERFEKMAEIESKQAFGTTAYALKGVKY